MTLVTGKLVNTSLRSLIATISALVLGVFVLASCSSDLAPLSERRDIPQPTFVAVEVTPAPESPTATPWPFVGSGVVRGIPDGLDPELFSPAESDEVVDLWTDLLTGSTLHTTSNRLYFRGRGRFDGELHMCPGGTGHLDGDPSGDVKWSLSPSVGAWYEVALTHEIPGRLESVTFVLSIQNGLPVLSGRPEVLEFTTSTLCANSDPGIERPSFTVENRRLNERKNLDEVRIAEIPWIGGEREFPSELSPEGLGSSGPALSVDYWNAYLTGGVVDAVAYDYGTFVLTEAFSGSLHMCGGRVAVLEGSPSGVGEWAVQAVGSNSTSAKILFTLPGDRTFRTLALSVTGDGPVLMGRDDDTGLIAASPLGLRESDECDGQRASPHSNTAN